MQNAKIQVKGNVYKVGFRYFVKQMAEYLHLFGVVKYSTDHNIIIEVSGNENAVNQFVGYCRIGSIGSKVEDVIISGNNVQYEDSFIIEFEEI